jgi:hypothetical protein
MLAMTLFVQGWKCGRTYNHADSNLLAVVLLLHRLVENNVQEDLILLAMFQYSRKSVPYIVTAEDANDLSAAVQLDEQSLVEVLQKS